MAVMERPKILLKMPNWVGDCVMATPAIAALRRTFPEARIDALARRGPAGVLAGNPDLNEVIAADERRLTPAQRRELRQTGYDAVALFPNSLRSAWLAWRLGIPRRAGYARPRIRRLLLTSALPYRPELWQTETPRPLSKKSIRGDRPAPGHMVAYYLEIAAAVAASLGGEFLPGPGDEQGSPQLILPVDPEAVARLEKLLEDQQLPEGRPLIALNPGAAYGNAKRYPLDQLAAAGNLLVERLQKSGAAPALVSTAAPNESHLNDELAAHLAAPLHRLGEQLDLPGLTALLDRAAVLITNDSGAMHMAAARRTPTVALFGPTDWNVTRPWSPAARVLRHSPDCAPCFLRECPIDHRCMRSITPEEVAEAAASLITSESSSGGSSR